MLRATNDELNAKNVLGHATVVDLVGATPDEHLHSDKLRKAELGELGREQRINWSELRGFQSAKRARAHVRVLEGVKTWFPATVEAPVIIEAPMRKDIWSRRKVKFILSQLTEKRPVRLMIGKDCYVEFSIIRPEGRKAILVVLVKGGVVRWSQRIRFRSNRRKMAKRLYNTLSSGLRLSRLMYICSG